MAGRPAGAALALLFALGCAGAAPRPASPPALERHRGEAFSIALPAGWKVGPDGGVVPAAGVSPKLRAVVSWHRLEPDVEALLVKLEEPLAAAGLRRLAAREQPAAGGAWRELEYQVPLSPPSRLEGLLVEDGPSDWLGLCGASEGAVPAITRACTGALASFRLGPPPGPARAGFQRVGAPGWSIELPADWSELPSAIPGKVFAAPETGVAPAILSVGERPRGEGALPARAKRLFAEKFSSPGATLEREAPLAVGAARAVSFSARFEPPARPAFLVARIGLGEKSGRALVATCGAADNAEPPDRAACLELVRSVRFERDEQR